MPTNVAGLADSHYIYKVSTDDGATYEKLNHLEKSDPIKQEKVKDDVTPTDAKNTHTAVVDFTEADGTKVTYALNPDDTVHQAIRAAYDNGTQLKVQLHFVNTKVQGYEYPALVSSHQEVYDDVKKKMRIEAELTFAGDITRITSAP